MPHLTAPLAHLVARRHGVVTRAELLADGHTRYSIQRSVSNGELVVCHPGVYRVHTSPHSFEARCVAACLTDDQLVVTGPAAARLWRFRHVPAVEVPVVLTDHDRNPLSGPVGVRRSNVLSSEDRVERDDGIVVASPPRTWFDCARDLDDGRFEALTEWVLDQHCSVPTLWRTVRRLDARGRPGLARVRRVMSTRSDWQRPAGSRLELRVLTALERAGLPELIRQHPLRLPNRVLIHTDGALPDLRWAVEVDHVTWHGGRVAAQRDKARDRGLRRLGWQVERVTDVDLREDFAGTIRELVALYHLRRRELAA